MIIFKHCDTLMHYFDSRNIRNSVIGFVPTMGALHEGHLSLLKQSKTETDITLCSIFINPTQFNDQTDYEKYPVSVEADIDKIESVNTDILFLPQPSELYPDGTTQLEQYELGHLEAILEGKFRPGHFQGVCQVMNRLLEIVRPSKLFMGQKDYQQSLVVQKLLKSTNRHIELIVCPTIREANGLAMSSRNRRLTEPDRKKAAIIFNALMHIKQNLKNAELTNLKNEARALISENGFTIDYVEIADAHTLKPTDAWQENQELVALVAAYINGVRLIDNMLLNREIEFPRRVLNGDWLISSTIDNHKKNYL